MVIAGILTSLGLGVLIGHLATWKYMEYQWKHYPYQLKAIVDRVIVKREAKQQTED